MIPVAVRRRLGLKTGQPLTIRANTQDEIVLQPADRDADAVDEMLWRLRAAARKLGGDPLRALHARRRRERSLRQSSVGTPGAPAMESDV